MTARRDNEIPTDCGHVAVTYLPDEPPEPMFEMHEHPTVAKQIDHLIRVLTRTKERHAEYVSFADEGLSGVHSADVARRRFVADVCAARVLMLRLAKPYLPEANVSADYVVTIDHANPTIIVSSAPKSGGLPVGWSGDGRLSEDGTKIVVPPGGTVTTPWIPLTTSPDVGRRLSGDPRNDTVAFNPHVGDQVVPKTETARAFVRRLWGRAETAAGVTAPPHVAPLVKAFEQAPEAKRLTLEDCARLVPPTHGGRTLVWSNGERDVSVGSRATGKTCIYVSDPDRDGFLRDEEHLVREVAWVFGAVLSQFNNGQGGVLWDVRNDRIMEPDYCWSGVGETPAKALAVYREQRTQSLALRSQLAATETLIGSAAQRGLNPATVAKEINEKTDALRLANATASDADPNDDGWYFSCEEHGIFKTEKRYDSCPRCLAKKMWDEA